MAVAVNRPAVGLTIKICLAGDSAVGKTSLVRRFVSDTFAEKYGTTLGAKVSSRRYRVEDPRLPGTLIEVGATIWDIMGNVGLRELLKDAYFHGVQGVLLVCDGTRPETFRSVGGWISSVRSVAGSVPAVLLVNKTDLKPDLKVSPADAEAFGAQNGWPWLPTSARTGENVEAAFTRIAQTHLGSLRGAPTSR